MLFTVLIIAIIVIVLFLVGFKKEHFVVPNNKPKLWVYLNTDYNSRKWNSFYSQSNTSHVPDYIKICLETIKNNCEDDFDIKIVNQKNISEYLPNLKINNKHNHDYIKDVVAANLLLEYGGIFMPASTLVLNKLDGLYRKVIDKNLYFAGFNCDSDEYRCNLGNDFRLNQSVYLAPANSPVINEFVSNLKQIEGGHKSDYSFSKTGQSLLSKILKKYSGMVKLFPASVSGTRDCVMKSITPDNLLSKNVTILLDPETTLMVTFKRSEIEENTKYNWFARNSKQQILLSNLWFSRLAEIGLDNKKISTWKIHKNTVDNYSWKKTKNVFIGKSPTRNS